MSNTVIKVQGLSKRYRIGLKEKKADTFMGQMMNLIKSPMDNFRQLRNLSRFNDNDESIFWALRDIEFEVQQGEVLGIIGHNGAGKSTLLKILSRITEPTSGEVRLRGRVSALLEVGTGFHPELTGRENIFMNGTILGMTRREIDAKLDEIVDFSGVEKYIDTPVKFYSSGMKVRLGFAVAAHLEPEILLIDEVLAVGDAAFQKKCLGKMEDISQNNGRTLLFVSHNMAAIQSICQKAIVLKNGFVVHEGDIISGVNEYNSSLRLDSENDPNDQRIIINESLNEEGITEIEYSQAFDLKIKINNFQSASCAVFLIIRNSAGEFIIHERIDNIYLNGEDKAIRFSVPPIWLRPGIYNYHFKLISSDVSAKNNRYISEVYTMRILGDVYAPKLLGSMTPNIPFHIE